MVLLEGNPIQGEARGVYKLLTDLKSKLELSKSMLRKAHDKQKSYHDSRKIQDCFKVGDRVLLYVKDLPLAGVPCKKYGKNNAWSWIMVFLSD